MEQNKQPATNEVAANTPHKYFTVFKLFPILIALATAAFSADYVATKYGTLASISAFVAISVLSFFIFGYAFHILCVFASRLCRFIFSHKR
jgi:hypothetical protein